MTQNIEATRELLLGTWQAIGLIGDALVRSGAIERAELLEPLAIAEALTHSLDRRHVAFEAVRGLITSAGDGDDPPVRRRCDGRPARAPQCGPRPCAGATPRLWSHACRPNERSPRR